MRKRCLVMKLVAESPTKGGADTAAMDTADVDAPPSVLVRNDSCEVAHEIMLFAVQ